MAVQTFDITDRDSWLKLREPDITASVAGALLGAHEYMTPFHLWALKTGKIKEDPEESPPMLRGRLLEPVAVQLLKEKRPTWKVWQPNVYIRDPDARLGATPDCYAVDPDREGFGIIQVKTVEPGIFRQKWINGEASDGSIQVQPPLWIAVQAIVEAHLAGAAWAAVSPMRVGFGVDIDVVQIPVHAGIIERVRAAVADFWKLIAEGGEPSADYARDGEIIERLYESDDGTEIDLSADNHILELVETRAALKAKIKSAEADIETIDNEVKAKIGSNSVAVLRDGRRITWREQHRKSFTAPAVDFRVLRYPRTAKEEKNS